MDVLMFFFLIHLWSISLFYVNDVSKWVLINYAWEFSHFCSACRSLLTMSWLFSCQWYACILVPREIKAFLKAYTTKLQKWYNLSRTVKLLSFLYPRPYEIFIEKRMTDAKKVLWKHPTFMEKSKVLYFTFL